MRIGDPRDPATLIGPLIDGTAADGMARALDEARAIGGTVHAASACATSARGRRLRPPGSRRDARAGRPDAPRDLRADPLRDALQRPRRGDRRPERGRGRPFSSIFTRDLSEAEIFLSASGSDCGIANVNIGRPAPRSAAPSAARRRPAAAARPGPIRGRPICGGHQHDQLRQDPAAGAGRDVRGVARSERAAASPGREGGAFPGVGGDAGVDEVGVVRPVAGLTGGLGRGRGREGRVQACGGGGCRPGWTFQATPSTWNSL